MDNAFLNGATLVFDLDGTLVDTAPDLARTLNHVLAGVGAPPRDPAKVRPFIGLGARKMIEDGLRAAGRAPEDEDMDALLAAFLDHYGEHIAVESRPYPGATAVLERAAEAGARLAICTNKYARLSRQLLAALDLERFFHAVAGRDSYGVWKPDPGHLTRAIESAGGMTARAVMVGDSEIDIKTAKAARVPVVAVSFGYSEKPLENFAPDRIIGHYDELENAISGLIPAR